MSRLLAVFLSEDGSILFTYPDTPNCLCRGDTVLFGNREYVIVGRRFNVSLGGVEFFLQETERRDKTDDTDETIHDGITPEDDRYAR